MVNYTCPKCGNTIYETEEIRTTGGTLSKLFDIQNKKFVAVICTRCGYTELYRQKGNTLEDIFDFFVGR